MKKALDIMQSLKFTHYDIVFQEVPNETTLVFNISNCPHHCKGCHSTYLSKDIGELLLPNINQVIEKYKNQITCVCFMGGDQNMEELEGCLKIVKGYNLKTCVYSGLDDVNEFKHVFSYLNFVKIGSYNQLLGGLSNITTNQIFYEIDQENNNKLHDKTYLFRKAYV